MKKYLSILSLLILLSVSVYGYDYDIYENATYKGAFLDEIIVDDNVTISLNLTTGGVEETGESCSIYLDSTSCNSTPYNFTFNNVTKLFEFYTSFNQSGAQAYSYVCGVEACRAAIVDVDERYLINLTEDLMSMETVQNNYTIEAFEFNASHDRLNGSCFYDTTGSSAFFGSQSVSFLNTYSSGERGVEVSCTFPVEMPTVNLTFNVSEYEPKLEFNRTLMSIGGTSFTLANFDLNGDLVDDLIVLGDDMKIFDGNDLDTAVYTSAGYDSSYEVFITDMDFDGDGDILIGGSSSVDLLTFTGGFSFSTTNLMTVTNVSANGIASFGAFEVNNDFYKDVLVLNGSTSNWDRTIFELNGSGIASNNSERFSIQGTSSDLDDPLIFDYNKDNIQDIVAIDRSGRWIKVFTRNNFTSNLSKMNYTELSLNYTPSDPAFRDVNSDGFWELSINNGSGNTYYSLSSGSINKISFEPLSGSIQENSQVDLMNSDTSGYLQSYFNSTFDRPLQQYYLNNSLKKSYTGSIFASSLLPFDFDLDGDSDLVASTFPPPLNLTLFENKIDDYIRSNSTNSGNISVVDSSVVNFTINPNTNYEYNDYFFKVKLGSNTYRNDYFDSQQNLKYYQVDFSNNYAFNFSSTNEYVAEFAINKYSYQLTDFVNETRFSPLCSSLLNDVTAKLTTFCIQFSGADLNNFSAKDIDVQNTTIEWNNVYSRGNLSLFNISDIEISNSDLGGNVTILDSEGIISNTTILNSTIFIDPTILTFENVSFGGSTITGDDTILTSINSDGFYDFTNSEISIFGPGNATLASNEVRFYEEFNVSLEIDGQNVTEEIRFNDSLNRTGTFTSGNPEWILTELNGTPVKTELSYFGQDLGEVNSGSTAFSIAGVSALENVTFKKSNLTILVPGPFNYTGINLSEVVSKGPTAFYFGLDTNASFEFNTSIGASFSTNPNIDVNYNSGQFTGNISESGTYRFIDNNPTYLVDNVISNLFNDIASTIIAFIAPSEKLFTSKPLFNGTFNLFKTYSQKDLNLSDENKQIMYFEGDLYGNGSSVEVVN